MAKHNKNNRGATSRYLYQVWSAMVNRCGKPNNPYYQDYGGRGIKVCDRWLESAWNFYEDMGDKPSPRHSIDRIDVNGDYTPENCRWADATIQSHNTRKRRDSNSLYYGVSFIKQRNRRKHYRVDVKIYNKKFFVGHYDNEIDAALAHDAAEIQLYGDEAKLNLL